MQNLDVLLHDVSLNKLLNKQWSSQWFEESWCSCDVAVEIICHQHLCTDTFHHNYIQKALLPHSITRAWGHMSENLNKFDIVYICVLIHFFSVYRMTAMKMSPSKVSKQTPRSPNHRKNNGGNRAVIGRLSRVCVMVRSAKINLRNMRDTWWKDGNGPWRDGIR